MFQTSISPFSVGVHTDRILGSTSLSVVRLLVRCFYLPPRMSQLSFGCKAYGFSAPRALLMTDAHPDNTYADDEIDLRELFLVLWEGKVLITMVTGLAAMVSFVVAISMPNIYQSTAILAPKTDGGTGGLSRLASQYGGLASLAGINLGGLGGDGMPKAAIAIEKMKSLSFFKQHLYEDLLVDLMAVESWVQQQTTNVRR